MDIALRGEIKGQCWRGRIAGLQLGEMLKANALEYDADQERPLESVAALFNNEIWSKVHSVLSSAGIVSRVLFPRPPSKIQPTSEIAKRNAERQRRAVARADVLWRKWPLPPRKDLRVLAEASARNAMEHAENGAPEWFAGRLDFPLLAYAVGLTPPKGRPSGIRGAYRFLFLDTWRVKIGSDSCDLRAVLKALQLIEDAIPTRSGIELALPFYPFRIDATGRKVRLNHCLLSVRPPPPSKGVVFGLETRASTRTGVNLGVDPSPR